MAGITGENGTVQRDILSFSKFVRRYISYLGFLLLNGHSLGFQKARFLVVARNVFTRPKNREILRTKLKKTIKKTTLDNLPSTLNKNLHSKSTYFLKLTHQESWRSNGFLKGQSQLIHMRIRYHFLATRVKHKVRILKTNLAELN